jgi:glycosyltransferase domain-containing protein
MDLKTDFTLIITLHNRKNSIGDLLSKYGQLPYQIILADSSDSPYNGELPSNTTHIETPGELYYKKMYDILLKVSTPYVLELPDDDYVYSEAIEKCLEFLIENPTYSYADGFSTKSSGRDIWKNQCEFYTTYSSNNFKERIVTHLNKHWKAPNHTIVKTEILTEIYKFVLDRPALYPVRYFDKIWTYISCYYGNNRSLEIPYIVRGDGLGLIRSENNYPSLLEKNTPYNSILTSERIELLAEFLVNKGYPHKESTEFITQVFSKVKD